MKRVIVLGSTGSIGRSALDVIRRMPGRLKVVGLSAHSRWEVLARQIQEFQPEAAAVADATAADRLRSSLGDGPTRLLDGPDASTEMAGSVDADIILTAIVGSAGLSSTIEAAKSGGILAVANKEPLVMAGDVIVRLANERGTTVVPVDSEHSAIFQALRAGKRDEVRKVVITASGGAFLDVPIEDLGSVTPDQAMKHPTWNMGKKVTIDSATLMNKALEIIEAKWLFGLSPDQVEVVIHPQSIVHSMVEFCDGSVVGQLGIPDMRMPIQFALTYPDRSDTPVPSLDLVKVATLSFYEPDLARFPALRLGFEAARVGGTMGAVLNAANEVAVESFVCRRTGFADIIEIVETVMERHSNVAEATLDDILEADRWAREEAAVCL